MTTTTATTEKVTKIKRSTEKEKPNPFFHPQTIIKFEQQFNGAQLNLVNNDVRDLLNAVEKLSTLYLELIHKHDDIINVKGRSITNDPVVIQIDNLIPIDLLRNGMKCGPWKQSRNEEPFNRVKGSTLQDYEDEEMLLIGDRNKSGVSKSPILARNLIILKYLIPIQLNRNFFHTTLANDKEKLYTIELIKKPINWKQYDYEQLIIKMPKSTKQSYNYLNLKALTDKLFSHLNNSLHRQGNDIFNDLDKQCTIDCSK
jgi:hypothetical protein